jgi:hypothetical protein
VIDMAFGGPLKPAVDLLNRGVTSLTGLPLVGRFTDRYLTTITYVGRRSGKSFSIPVNYWRKGEDVRIAVAFPDSKSWWRNFLDDGAPLTLRLNGAERTGHATAKRDEKGRVTVRVRF